VRDHLQHRLDAGGHRDVRLRSRIQRRRRLAPPMQLGAAVRTEYLSRQDADVVHRGQLDADADGPVRSGRWTAGNALSVLNALSAAAVKTGQPADAVRWDEPVPVLALNLRRHVRLELANLPTRMPTVLRARLPARRSARPARVALAALMLARACLHRRPMERLLPAPRFRRLQQAQAFRRRDDDGVRQRQRLALERVAVLRLPEPHRGDGASEQRPE